MTHCWGVTMGVCGGCPTTYSFEKMDEDELAWKSHKHAFAEEFAEPGGSVAEGVVGKIYCPCREDSLLSALRKWFCRNAGNSSVD